MKRYIKPDISVENINLTNIILDSGTIGANMEAFEQKDYPFQIFEN